jgi:hypothetical protein
LALLPDGRLFFAFPGPVVPSDAGVTNSESPSPVEIMSLSLPPLPEGFVYTGLGLSGETLFVSWEEQQGYAIGAAGFMVLKPFGM